jgi:hypothetical protein
MREMNRDEMRGRKGHSCLEMHITKGGKDWAAVAFSSIRPGMGVFIADGISMTSMLQKHR